MKKIYFITAGEYPADKSLLIGKVIQFMSDVKKYKDLNVEWLGVFNYKQFLKDIYLRKGKKFAYAKVILDESNIAYKAFLSPFRLNQIWIFVFRNFFSKMIARKMANYLRTTPEESFILHCRSYFSTDIGVEIKKLMPERDISVVCDLRSLLPEELPIIHKKTGKLLYGFSKQWEHKLLLGCDKIISHELRSKALLCSQHGIREEKISIIREYGYFESDVARLSFEERWDHHTIGYVGTLGGWHSEKLLVDFFKIVRERGFLVESYGGGNDAIKAMGASCKTIPANRIKDYYNPLLAVVVQGSEENTDFFVQFKMGIHFFSSKAAEALSLGIPLVVNRQIGELSDFVAKHECGIIFDMVDGKICFPDDVMNRLEEKSFWKEKSDNALKVSSQFTKDFSIGEHCALWEKL